MGSSSSSGRDVNVITVLHVIACFVLIVVVLLQQQCADVGAVFAAQPDHLRLDRRRQSAHAHHVTAVIF
jgi:protein translocase SecG subunit